MSKLTGKQILAVGIGGIFGTLLRYCFSLLLTTKHTTFPIDTLVVNLIGSFFLAFVLTLSIKKLNLNQTLLTCITAGILGSFTTFSTIILDIFSLYHEHVTYALVYLITTLFGGFIFTFIGILIGQRI